MDDISSTLGKTDEMTVDEFEELFDRGEDPEGLYDWVNAKIMPPLPSRADASADLM